MEEYGNAQVARLPRRLRTFVIDQDYEKYTAVDQAVWRYVMRQNYYYLKDIAYYPYIKGLERAGLSIERIPDLPTMNRNLSQIGWGAVTVDGFIPPAAFMEFQAYKVLVIAADIRQLNHIQYTPTPDIIHESAGHAPIIADQAYADYLRHFGEIGSKALYSKQDFDLYESIRKLSILKELPGSKKAEIEMMEKEVLDRQKNMGEPSEMALLSRLHWWTVEYGMIGSLEHPKIYGAGLLSSIGESVSCMLPTVEKRWYTSEAVHTPFDITSAQPQLFVTPDFETLLKVLNDFASTMAFNQGGILALDKGISSSNTCTVTLNSGMQLSGKINSYRTEKNEIVFLDFKGSCAFAYNHKEIPGMSAHRFPEGICLPMGPIDAVPQGLENCSELELHEIGLVEGDYGMLEYNSGYIFHGTLKRIIYQEGRPVLLTWLDAELMEPDSKSPVKTWEYFELPLGSQVISVFNGAADKEAFYNATFFNQTNGLALKPASGLANNQDKNPFLEEYKLVRRIREESLEVSALSAIWLTVNDKLDKGWLCALEILEIALEHEELSVLSMEIRAALLTFSASDEAYTKLITDGLILLKPAKLTMA